MLLFSREYSREGPICDLEQIRDELTDMEHAHRSQRGIIGPRFAESERSKLLDLSQMYNNVKYSDFYLERNDRVLEGLDVDFIKCIRNCSRYFDVAMSVSNKKVYHSDVILPLQQAISSLGAILRKLQSI